VPAKNDDAWRIAAVPPQQALQAAQRATCRSARLLALPPAAACHSCTACSGALQRRAIRRASLRAAPPLPSSPNARRLYRAHACLARLARLNTLNRRWRDCRFLTLRHTLTRAKALAGGITVRAKRVLKTYGAWRTYKVPAVGEKGAARL